MNIKYDTGNVIRSATTFDDFKFPNELPTEEWAGNEARSYCNYIRPVANLFENDKELDGFVKDLFKGITADDQYAVISGCTLKKTTINNTNYFELTHGGFIFNGKVYHVFPACEAVAKQIESENEIVGNGDVDVKISYDYNSDKYQYSYTVNYVTISGEGNSAAETVYNILSGLNLLDEYTVESHIILPMFKELLSKVVFFYDNTVSFGSEAPILSVVFATVSDEGEVVNTSVLSKIDGDKIEDNTVKNSSLINNSITLGSTNINLGETVTDITSINSINNISQSIDVVDGIVITDGTNSIKIKGDYTLGDASKKSVTDDMSSSLNELPTSKAVKDYIKSEITEGGASFTGTINFNNINAIGTITAANGVSSSKQVNITDITDASRTSGALSGNASIYTAGGLEVEKNIYANGNIVGLNSGTYSHSSLKENIYPFVESAVDLINHVMIMNYTYKDDKEHNHKIGFLADYTHEYFATKEHNIMDQSNCIGILLKAVQELSSENKQLKERLDDIESQLNK